jgi:dual specificity tyrosine-phosphorylation-regulated kinase 2/3/4
MTLLASLNAHDVHGQSCIVKLFDWFEFRSHICGSFEMLGGSLYERLKQNNFKPEPMAAVRPIARQLLSALAFSHSRGIVHCDLKPENVLTLPRGAVAVRLIDFGSACEAGTHPFSYVQSRFYRAPEVILGLEYGPPMDVWSFACLVAELMVGRPIFAGDSEAAQLRLLSGVLGPVPPALIDASPRRAAFFHIDRRPRTGPPPERRTLADATGIRDPHLIDLLERCLQWDQKDRVTAAGAIEHPFFTRDDRARPTGPASVGTDSPRRK